MFRAIFVCFIAFAGCTGAESRAFEVPADSPTEVSEVSASSSQASSSRDAGAPESTAPWQPAEPPPLSDTGASSQASSDARTDTRLEDAGADLGAQDAPSAVDTGPCFAGMATCIPPDTGPEVPEDTAPDTQAKTCEPLTESGASACLCNVVSYWYQRDPRTGVESKAYFDAPIWQIWYCRMPDCGWAMPVAMNVDGSIPPSTAFYPVSDETMAAGAASGTGGGLTACPLR